MLGVETASTMRATDPLMNSDLFDADDDESDEEVFRSMKSKQKRPTKSQRLILSDDEDEERSPSLLDQGKSQSDGEESDEDHGRNKQEMMDDDDDDGSNDDSDKDKPKQRKSIQRSIGSSDDSDDDLSNDRNKPKERKKIRKPVESSDDSDDDLSNGDDDNKPKQRKKIRKPVESSDDSDDSSNDDSDNDKPKEKKSRRPVRSSDDSDEDDSSDEEEEIAFQLTPPPQDPEADRDKRSMRRKRINKDELQQIHSETQRIVRESTIRIPYHRPTPLSLDELFNKKPSHTALRPIGARVPRIHGKELLNTSAEQEKGQESCKEETDELPDLLSSQVQDGPGNKVSCEENSECSSENVQAEVKPSETATDNVTMVNEAVAADGTLLQDAPKERSRSSPVADGKSAQSPTSSSASQSNQKELSPQNPSQDSPKESLPRTSQQPLQEDQAPIFKTPPPTTSTQPDPQSSQARRMKRLQDSLIRLKGVQPKLSGGPKITIDLEEGGEPSAEEKGVVKLKNRFVQHTKHIKVTHQKDVQVNIVTKEKGEDGKEDLKHHTFTVGLDKQPEQIDPSLNVPGAKLCHLKQNLQATMRVKREQERLKRREAYKLDNEEGFGGEEDEDEAELTDGSETEGEEERGMIGHEDEDADYEPGNEFLDDEAESDDDDDGNEMGDEMDDEEEEEEESTVFKKLKKKSRSLEKESTLIDSDDEISPSRRKGSKRRATVVDDVEDGGDEEKGISLRLDSTGTEDTDTEISDVLQDSSRFNSVRTPRTPSAMDQCSKTMEMYDSATNSTVSDFQVPISRVDSSSKKVVWSASKDTDSSKDSMSFVLPAPVRQDSSSNSLDTSFEAMTSLIPAHQPQGGMTKSGRASVDSTKGETFTPFSRHQSVLSNSTSKTVSRNELTLPVEDSQDLFREDYPRLPTIADSQQVTESQSFHFSFEDETQTQFLDENGLLNLKPSTSSKKKTMFEDTQTHSAESQSSMDELLGLCSGQFAATQGQDDVTSQKPGPFSQVSQRAGTQANMDELLNLCSGTFTEMESKSQITSTRKVEEKDEKEDDDHLSFHIASDHDGPDSDDDVDKGFSSDEEDVAPKKRRRIIQQESDEEEEEEEAEKGEEESDLDSEFEFNRDLKDFKGKTYSKKLNLANFVEDEAELSGSEADSDENYDAEDDDEEIEGIINEEVGDEDELRDQVNKVHLKTVDDDDARRLRILKEMYLPDGDLHSDNKGRTRKFRWRHMDSQMDMFRPGSDGEEDEEDGQDQDSQWRLMRYQREQWLKENEEKTDAVSPDIVTSSLDEKSQFAKCLKAATFKKPQVETSTQEVEDKEQKKDPKIATTKPLNIMNKRGSFLSRSKNDLAKMASMLKPVANPQGPRSTRNFVFQSAESSFGEETIAEPPKVKRSASVSGPSTTPSGPRPKRPRLERSQSQFTSNSVFRHF